MAFRERSDFAASSGLPSSDNPSSLIEQLSEELSLQQAVFASLRDLPQSDSTKAEIAAVKAQIADIRRKLTEARRKGFSTTASMEDASETDPFEGNRQNYGSSTPSSASDSKGSSTGEGSSNTPSIPSRKRSIGSSHLGVDSSHLKTSKSRRTSPSPGLGAFRSGSGYSGDIDFSDLTVIDLTGDDDEVMLSTIRAQKEAENRASRRKAEEDRDAAVARQLVGRTSPPPNGPTFAEPSHPGRNNAFDRILGRSSQTSGTPSRSDRHVKPEPGSTLATRPLVSVKSEPGSHARQSNEWHFSRPSDIKPGPEPKRFRMPGAYLDSDSDSEGFQSGGSQQPRPQGNSSWAFLSSTSFPTLPSQRPMAPLHSASQNPTYPPSRVGMNDSVLNHASVPAIGVNQQPSVVAAGSHSRSSSSSCPPSGQHLRSTGNSLTSPFGGLYPLTPSLSSPNFPSSGADRPGYVQNGAYYSAPAQPGLTSSLAAAINRVNNYDFNAMVDADGNPLSSRLVGFLDDFVNDPRKTEKEIQQLLSNIRPDMDIPEEERGETPEAMKYPLYAHQQLALKWMTDMEEGTNKGGILADDMGLGKTVSTLALMVSRQSSDNVKTNLIIGPLALIKQWEREVKTKLKASHRLSVFLLHQRKKLPFSELKRYDVVLTTYGMIASELKQYDKHVEQRKESAQYDVGADVELARKCPLLHPRSKFYRIILDEAQCVKNKDTQGSRGVHKINATYRWCLTGTPMMNNVSELYALIRFLRIRPYCEFKIFQQTFKSLTPRGNGSDITKGNAMRQLQAVLKAVMLRRMKNSTIDGKPILTLPEKTENLEHVAFSEDELQFYRDLETKSQVQFNKYLRAGTVGKNYSNILALLLRLRQACCHPHLTDFDYVGCATSENEMEGLAKDMAAAVVERIKAIDAFECPICYDAVDDPILLIPCGHDTCSECFASLTDNSAQHNIRSGNEDASARCPVCRGPVEPTKVISYTAFRKVHMPETVETAEADDALLEATDSDSSSSDDDEDSDTESVGSLADFIVPDEVDDDEDDEAKLDAELEAAAKAKEAKQAKELAKKTKADNKTKGKAKTKAKAKLRPEDVKPYMLKKLRKEAAKNKEARRRYMHFLRDNWQDSAKVTQVIELLTQIQETEEKTIIFSQWTGLLDLVECQIKYKLGLRYCRYSGDMSRNQRDGAVQDFTENPRNRVMLVSLRAGNAGLNLTAASRIIICDPFWNPYIEMQAVDRAHRIGQQREVRVHRILVKETVEDRILELQEKKRRLVEAALDEGESKNVGRLSERELAYIFGVNPARN
ncbi:hypothetical protein VTK56DRAFT_2171 [Thermocarpiscus australiensis]